MLHVQSLPRVASRIASRQPSPPVMPRALAQNRRRPSIGMTRQHPSRRNPRQTPSRHQQKARNPSPSATRTRISPPRNPSAPSLQQENQKGLRPPRANPTAKRTKRAALWQRKPIKPPSASAARNASPKLAPKVFSQTIWSMPAMSDVDCSQSAFFVPPPTASSRAGR